MLGKCGNLCGGPLFHRFMGSLKARSLVWVLVVLVGCSVLVRLTRDPHTEESETVLRSGGTSVIVDATEFILRLGFAKSEAVAEKGRWDPHPPNCICHKVLEQVLARCCAFKGSILVAERRDKKVVGLRVKTDDPEHLLLRLGLEVGDLVTGIEGERFDILEFQAIVRRGLLSEHRIELQIERRGKMNTLIAKLLDDGTFEVEVLEWRPLVSVLERPADFMGKGYHIKPALEDGEVIGLQLSLSNTEHPLYELGLRDQDILLSLNGTALNGPESHANIYRTLRTTEKLEFKVIRNGQVQSVIPILED